MNIDIDDLEDDAYKHYKITATELAFLILIIGILTGFVLYTKCVEK
jgi:hypothetical protein